LVSRIENIDVVALAQEKEHVDITGTVLRPSRNEDQRLALSGFPVSEFDTIVRLEIVDLEVFEIGERGWEAFDPIWESVVLSEDGDRGCC
jgi:hypothetical protein